MNLIHTAFEPSGAGPFPAVVTLHGWGANAFDLLALAPYVASGRLLMLCPQGPLELGGDLAQSYSWFPLQSGMAVDAAAVTDAAKRIESFIDDALRRYPIDPCKMALIGFSQGGVMAYALAMTRPERFAAIAALSSWFPEELARGRGPLPNEITLPAFVAHGTEDDLVAVERARESIQRLQALGLSPDYREYACGHEIGQQSMYDLSDFLAINLLGEIQP